MERITEAQWKHLEHDEFVHLFGMWDSMPDGRLKATASQGSLFYSCYLEKDGTIMLNETEFHTQCLTRFRFESAPACMACIDKARRNNPQWLAHKRMMDRLNRSFERSKKLNKVTV